VDVEATEEGSPLVLLVVSVDPFEVVVVGPWVDDWVPRLRLASPPAGEPARERKKTPPLCASYG